MIYSENALSRPRMQHAGEESKSVSGPRRGGSSVLDISLSPATAYVISDPEQNSIFDLNITIANTSSKALDIAMLRFTLPLGHNATDLCSAGVIKQIRPNAVENEAWDLGDISASGHLLVQPQRGESNLLEPGKNFTFHIDHIQLNRIEGNATVKVEFQFKNGQPLHEKVIIKKKVASMGINFFSSEPSSIQLDDSAQLSWDCTQINKVIIDPEKGELPSSGVLNVQPLETTAYTLYAYGTGILLSKQRTISVQKAAVLNFHSEALEGYVDEHSMLQLDWIANRYTKRVSLTSHPKVALPAELDVKGEFSVGPIVEETEFTLIAFDEEGNESLPQNLTVGVNKLKILEFTQSEYSVTLGESITLKWKTENAKGVNIISPSSEFTRMELNANGEVTLGPLEKNTHFKLQAYNSAAYTIEPNHTLTTRIQPPKINFLTIQPDQLVLGKEVTVAWNVENVTELSLAGMPEVLVKDGVNFKAGAQSDFDTKSWLKKQKDSPQDFWKNIPPSGSITFIPTAQYGKPSDYELDLKLSAWLVTPENSSLRSLNKPIQGFIKQVEGEIFEYTSTIVDEGFFTSSTKSTYHTWIEVSCKLNDVGFGLHYVLLVDGKKTASGHKDDTIKVEQMKGVSIVFKVALEGQEDVYMETANVVVD